MMKSLIRYSCSILPMRLKLMSNQVIENNELCSLRVLCLAKAILQDSVSIQLEQRKESSRNCESARFEIAEFKELQQQKRISRIVVKRWSAGKE